MAYGTAEGQPLARPEAFAALAGDDPRPLLVVRECDSCLGTDDAFLSRAYDNERTILLARWFHAVKLPPEVRLADHPLHAVFDAARPPHLFVANADGGGLVALDGSQSQSRLWSAMLKVLRANYGRDPDRAVAEFRKLLDQLDENDSQRDQLAERQAEERIAHGPDAPGLQDLEREQQELDEEREKLLDLGSRIDDLQPKPPKPRR